MGKTRRATLTMAIAALAAPAFAAAGAHAATPAFRTLRLPVPHVGSGTEPRVAIGPDDQRWVITSDGEQSGNAIVYHSPDGTTFTKTEGDLGGQTSATIDVDIVVLPSGRIIGSELDTAGLNFPTGYSDDGGKTWTQSTGTTTADQDRQWFAVGKIDPTTKKSRVYLLYHNLASGLANHNMFVETSTDGGATFGPPVPVTTPTPGNQDAYLDLQCGDSGGPSTIMADQRTGKVYVVFTTRAAPQNGVDIGGCAASVFGPIEVNVVAGTRVWVGQADADAQSFSDSLAVDHSADGHIVSMQLAYGALDRAGNIYVAYPESPRPYPDYSQAAVRYVFSAPGDTLKWSDPRELVPNGPAGDGGGHELVHIAAGDPGQLAAAYYTGEPQATGKPAWFLDFSQTQDGFAAKPAVDTQRISDVKTYRYTASEMMAACDPDKQNPAQGVESGFVCNRSADVWGIALDRSCRTTIAWPTGTKDQTDESADRLGTYVSTQTGGATLCEPGGAASAPGTSPGQGGSGGGGSGTTPASACPDRTPPVSHAIKRNLRASRTRVKLRGNSRDAGCVSSNLVPGVGKIERVDVSIAKVRGKGNGSNCRFLKANGRLSGNRRCRKPVLLPAKGLESWSLSVKARLPQGHYRAVVRAVDASRNKERPAKGRNIVLFDIK
ncbi:MAG: repeat-like domain [Thermoleophilaceae bacterium]|nr:repeat-like domain [Thermoleophilaceae bacterium]